MGGNQTESKGMSVLLYLIGVFLFGVLVTWYVFDPDLFKEISKSIGGPIAVGGSK
ncbi:hypothetical protein [Bacillus cereus group sp. BfR-BA-01309]|uniref:hypothetical protein n=1 Tax=Bacillus cereus group sp. BfR-BA-01309 TaxID=2920286 RepID=UPI001F5A54A4|nr:hypothetical protein [Bacillus cereus group sp. BfR-BA-01309]